MENLDNIESSERVEVPKSGVLNIQTKLPSDTNASKGQEETPITGVPEFNLVMRDQPEDKEYWARQAGTSVKFGETADEYISRAVMNPVHTSMFGSQSPQLSREELSDFGLDKAQKESIVATAGGNPKDYTDEDVYRATYPIDETKFSMSRANVMEASENEQDYNINYNKAIQQELVDAGYDLGNTGDEQNGVDGIMGKKTRAAADEFQAKKAIGDIDAVPSQFDGHKDLGINFVGDTLESIRSVESPNDEEGVLHMGAELNGVGNPNTTRYGVVVSEVLDVNGDVQLAGFPKLAGETDLEHATRKFNTDILPHLESMDNWDKATPEVKRTLSSLAWNTGTWILNGMDAGDIGSSLGRIAQTTTSQSQHMTGLIKRRMIEHNEVSSQIENQEDIAYAKSSTNNDGKVTIKYYDENDNFLSKSAMTTTWKSDGGSMVDGEKYVVENDMLVKQG